MTIISSSASAIYKLFVKCLRISKSRPNRNDANQHNGERCQRH